MDFVEHLGNWLVVEFHKTWLHKAGNGSMFFLWLFFTLYVSMIPQFQSTLFIHFVGLAPHRFMIVSSMRQISQVLIWSFCIPSFRIASFIVWVLVSFPSTVMGISCQHPFGKVKSMKMLHMKENHFALSLSMSPQWLLFAKIKEGDPWLVPRSWVLMTSKVSVLHLIVLFQQCLCIVFNFFELQKLLRHI